MNSNYRQYYCNDPEFFIKVLGQETGPFNFKMHAFPNSKHRAAEGDEDTEGNRVQHELKIGELLEKYQANDIRFAKIAGGSGEDRSQGNKTRYNFTIVSAENAQ